MFHWFLEHGYKQGVFWALMISVFSITNDVLMKHLGDRLPVIEISFFRFLFCMLTALPFILSQGGVKMLKTQAPWLHVWRALLGAAALGLTCYSVNIMPLAENTTIMFAEPLFFLPCAYFWLKEKVDTSRWLATGVGFLGLIVILQPTGDVLNVHAFIPMGAAFLFALLNVLAKKMVHNEHNVTMLFYFGLGTTLCAAIPLPFYWVTPNWNELFWLVLLGGGGNMIQVCLFLAFAATDASALAPFRYAEFIVAACFGYLFFDQIPTPIIGIGALIIMAATCYITVIETRKERTA